MDKKGSDCVGIWINGSRITCPNCYTIVEPTQQHIAKCPNCLISYEGQNLKNLCDKRISK